MIPKEVNWGGGSATFLKKVWNSKEKHTPHGILKAFY